MLGFKFGSHFFLSELLWNKERYGTDIRWGFVGANSTRSPLWVLTTLEIDRNHQLNVRLLVKLNWETQKPNLSPPSRGLDWCSQSLEVPLSHGDHSVSHQRNGASGREWLRYPCQPSQARTPGRRRRLPSCHLRKIVRVSPILGCPLPLAPWQNVRFLL